MKLSVCIDAVYNKRDFFESLAEIHRLGFQYFEFWCWWDKDVARIKQEKDRLGMTVSSFCTKFISLVDKTKREEYIQGLKETIKIAKFLDCSNIITQVGDELPGVPRERQRESLIEGLKECVPLLEEADLTLLVEPLNTLVDHQGYFLWSSQEAFDIIRSVNNPHVKILYDIYHQQIMEGHLISRITSNIEKIGHFHAAGNPGRHELDSGEIHYRNIFEVIQKTGYNGFLALEYFPTQEPGVGLSELLKS